MQLKFYRLALSLLVLSAVISPVSAKTPSAEPCTKAAESHLKDRVKASVVIKAPLPTVWTSVLQYRRHDPEVTYFKPLTHEGDITTIEEGFEFPTIFGSGECKLHFTEAAPNRVDFKMLESEDFRAMEGSWVLTPAPNGKDTILELSSYVDPKMLIPHGLVNTIIQHRLDKRVNKVKHMAENPGVSMADSKKH